MPEPPPEGTMQLFSRGPLQQEPQETGEGEPSLSLGFAVAGSVTVGPLATFPSLRFLTFKMGIQSCHEN